MRTTATVALRPNNEAPRPPVQGERGMNFVNHDADEFNLAARRRQRLIALFGMTERRARVVADLAWGESA